jgi:hypothetical protein
VTPSLDHFYSEDPRRQRSRESDFGVQWREEAAGPRFRVSWIEATGELYALRQDPSHMVELLGRVPRSGHPDPLRSDLIVEAVLAGWEHRCGQPGSLRWARDSVRAIEGEPLAPIDWSVRCLASCCPRPGTATALTEAAGGPSCSACGAPLVVAAHGVPPRQLELELCGGAWWLARRRA